MHWEFEGAIGLDSLNEWAWEHRCRAIGGIPDWARITVKKEKEMQFIAMGCFSPDVLQKIKERKRKEGRK
ncbi:hypothetical protein LCGC14_1234600 [marine sediment metagenome]|uniref:Uncharacterized protein n=1 Tax=marine sediment metagenome TaxID=412755 RepID=A0A0F9NPS0_9ZZZZ